MKGQSATVGVRTVEPSCKFVKFVSQSILLEAKALEKLTDSHLKQVLNYLAASKLRVGLLVNFGGDVLEWKRVIL
jgi:GxxExxY protein